MILASWKRAPQGNYTPPWRGFAGLDTSTGFASWWRSPDFGANWCAVWRSAPSSLLERTMVKQHFGSSHVPLSPAVRAGDFIYVSGQVPVGADGSIVAGGVEAQTRQVLENVRTALRLAGADLADVVKTTVILSDARDFGAFNKAYGSYFSQNPPARTTLEARLMIDIKVEIEAVAYKPV
jgi:2-iminobutanoate/2-iminopropanoate deaminase